MIEIRLFIAVLLVGALGFYLVLSHLRWFNRPNLRQRLAPFTNATDRPEVASPTVQSLIINGLSLSIERLVESMGVSGNLERRLVTSGSLLSPQSFRSRQGVAAFVGMATGLLISALLSPPTALAIALVIAPPLVAVLGFEQHLVSKVDARRKLLLSELPVVSEQLAMYLNAGQSVGAAIGQVARRSNGICAQGFAAITDRIRQGLTTEAALQEWSQQFDMPELDRLVAVLSLGPGTSEIGKLVSEEARSIRLEVHRRLLETMDKRAQQVWVPVTIATLIPGVIFLAIPFTHALRGFTGS